jgi:hypothetical protein
MVLWDNFNSEDGGKIVCETLATLPTATWCKDPRVKSTLDGLFDIAFNKIINTSLNIFIFLPWCG